MIRPLRARHRLIWSGLAVALPVVYGLALADRQRAPVDALPAALADGQPPPHPAAWTEREVGPGLVLEVAEAKGGGAPSDILWLRPRADWTLPDLLVYWSDSAPQSEDDLAAAVLLGSLDGARPRAFRLPRSGAGHLTVFSLAHRKRIASFPL